MFSGDVLRKVEEPLLAKGIVLEVGKQRYVLCALDWCELCNFTSRAAAATSPWASCPASLNRARPRIGTYSL